MKYVYDNFVNVPIDMRHNAEILTQEFGIDVILIKNCKFVKCTCFDDLNKTGDPKCKFCHGSGWFSSMQKIKAIESSNGTPYFNTSFLFNNRGIGITDQKMEVYYIRQQYNPKERDIILKVTWKNNIPVDVVKVLEINSVYEMRGDNGRNELNGCTIIDRTDMVTTYNKMLKSIPIKAIKEMAKGGKSIWPNLVM